METLSANEMPGHSHGRPANVVKASGFAYPTDLPVDAATEVVRILRAGTLATESQVFIKRAYEVVGYMLGKFVGEPDAEQVYAADPAATALLDEFAPFMQDDNDPEICGALISGGAVLKFLLRKIAEALLS